MISHQMRKNIDIVSSSVMDLVWKNLADARVEPKIIKQQKTSIQKEAKAMPTKNTVCQTEDMIK